MEICDSANLLSSDFAALSLEPRQTGLIDIVNMKWNSPDAKLVEEFKCIYTSRLEQLQKMLPYPNITPISKVSEDKVTYSIRGIVKRLEHNRVRAFEKNYQSKYSNDNPIYSDLDEFEIEDITGKIKFCFVSETTHTIPNLGKIKHTDLPNGICLILVGKYKKHDNIFNVKQAIIPELPPQLLFNANFTNSDGVSFKEKKVLVVSEPTFDVCSKITMILGTCCHESANICALVIIGGMKMKTEEIAQMGKFIEEVKNYIDVFIMPSSGQERHNLFPLRPYNGLYFLKSQDQIGLCSNPQLFQCQNGLNMHVSCGQNVKDFMKNSVLPKSEVEVMELMLRFNHFCPTSPFSLKTQPFSQDHLIVDELPHIMVSGKAKHFQVKHVNFGQSKEVLLVAIPDNKMALIGLNGSFCKELL